MKKILFLLSVIIAFTFVSKGYFLTPEARAETVCLIRFNIFDSKVYDPSVAEGLMIKDNLVAKGALVNAVKYRKLPFDSNTGDSKIISSVFNELEIQLCGKIGSCEKKYLDMQVVCEAESSIGTTIDEAQLAYNRRIANMSTCQKEVFIAIQNKNTQYLQAVKIANSQYYQKLAPLTVNLLKLYRYSKDDKSRELLLNDYVLANKVLRGKLYNSQTKVFNKFINDRTVLQKSFDDCK